MVSTFHRCALNRKIKTCKSGTFVAVGPPPEAAGFLGQGRGGGCSSSTGGVGLPSGYGSTEHLTVGGGVETCLQDPALLLLLDTCDDDWSTGRYSPLSSEVPDMALPHLSLGAWYTGSSKSSEDQDDWLSVTVAMLSVEPNWLPVQLFSRGFSKMWYIGSLGAPGVSQYGFPT